MLSNNTSKFTTFMKSPNYYLKCHMALSLELKMTILDIYTTNISSLYLCHMAQIQGRNIKNHRGRLTNRDSVTKTSFYNRKIYRKSKGIT